MRLGLRMQRGFRLCLQERIIQQGGSEYDGQPLVLMKPPGCAGHWPEHFSGRAEVHRAARPAAGLCSCPAPGALYVVMGWDGPTLQGGPPSLRELMVEIGRQTGTQP